MKNSYLLAKHSIDLADKDGKRHLVNAGDRVPVTVKLAPEMEADLLKRGALRRVEQKDSAVPVAGSKEKVTA